MYFIFLVIVLSLSGYHNALLGLFNDSIIAVNPKLPFVKQSDIIAYGLLKDLLLTEWNTMVPLLPTGH